MIYLSGRILKHLKTTEMLIMMLVQFVLKLLHLAAHNMIIVLQKMILFLHFLRSILSMLLPVTETNKQFADNV